MPAAATEQQSENAALALHTNVGNDHGLPEHRSENAAFGRNEGADVHRRAFGSAREGRCGDQREAECGSKCNTRHYATPLDCTFSAPHLNERLHKIRPVQSRKLILLKY